MSNNDQTPLLMIAVGVLVVITLGAAFFFVRAGRVAMGPPAMAPLPAPPVPAPPSGSMGLPVKLSDGDIRELRKRQHQAIGYLENSSFVEAIPQLKKIAEKLPQDEFAVRNLAIAYSLGLGQPTLTPEDARQAADRLIELKPQDPISYLLAGRIALKDSRNDDALRQFKQALKLDPKRPGTLFEAYDVGWLSSDPEVRKEALADIKAVQKLAPKNLAVALHCLKAQADRQIEDVQITDTITAVAPLLLPMTDAVKKALPNYDLTEQVGKLQLAIEALKSDPTPAKWNAVRAVLLPMSNVLSSRPAVKADLAAMRPNELDFLRFDYDEATTSSWPKESPADHPAVAVTWETVEQPLITGPVVDFHFTDFDVDSFRDLVVLRQDKVEVFRWDSEAKSFTSLLSVPVEGAPTHLLACDLDWDPVPVKTPTPEAKQPPGEGTHLCHMADPDLILYGPAGIQIWKNEAAEDGTRQLVAVEQTQLSELKDVRNVTVGDFDHDGDLDLVVAHEKRVTLLSNQEQLQFGDITNLSSVPESWHVIQLLPVDWDRDVDLDFIVVASLDEASPPQLLGYLQNVGHGEMRWQPFEFPADVQLPGDVREAALLDVNGDASWDFVLATATGTFVATTTTPPAPAPVRFVKVEPASTKPSTGLQLLDYDNDGYVDLWNGATPPQIYRGQADGTLALVTQLPAETARPNPPHCVDIDLDGDLDLLLAGDGLQVIRNDGGNQNHWLDIRLRALQIKGEDESSDSKRVNHQGIGSLLELRTGALYQPQIVTGDVTHFGLGKREAADLVRVIWTNGVPQGIVGPKGDREVCEVQMSLTSCPFLYVWNGERFEFFTDLLWNAPLGLQLARWEIAKPRAWEYLNLPGERMHLKDGKYVLQVTSELWEADYFDQVELLAIDHPADVAVYSNEKVGPPSLAEHRIHTVRKPQMPITAFDQRGRDVWPDIAVRDNVYTKCFDHKICQGLTEEHYVELDLGALENPKQIMLYLTGWMYPSVTSIRFGLSENPAYPTSRPPSLWAPDASGEWREVRPFMGFPGGKTKTIAIDISDVCVPGDYRVRIVTNMEFYWDHAFFTVDEPPAETRTIPLPLVSADLHYRGFSQHFWPAGTGNAPEAWDYSAVSTGPRWPPMQGEFTRYGDVRELLLQVDDQMVVAGAGDEMTLTFDPPAEPLPAGWKRDFILHNTGYDKDADLNTVYGQTTDPLPFQSMSGYPFEAHEFPPETPEYRAYLRKYQTRTQGLRGFWTDVLRKE